MSLRVTVEGLKTMCMDLEQIAVVLQGFKEKQISYAILLPVICISLLLLPLRYEFPFLPSGLDIWTKTLSPTLSRLKTSIVDVSSMSSEGSLVKVQFMNRGTH